MIFFSHRTVIDLHRKFLEIAIVSPFQMSFVGRQRRKNQIKLFYFDSVTSEVRLMNRNASCDFKITRRSRRVRHRSFKWGNQRFPLLFIFFIWLVIKVLRKNRTRMRGKKTCDRWEIRKARTIPRDGYGGNKFPKRLTPGLKICFAASERNPIL